jgi:ADP-heptose:LPS heptosyltransferase
MATLHIQAPRERALVRAADAALTIAAAASKPLRRRRSAAGSRQRILLLRMERIGDLVMALEAIRDVRTHAPDAEIDLVVGSWNVALAESIPSVNRVEALDARWLAREATGLSLPSLLRAATKWRTAQYDLAINFEPDIRSNMVLAAAGAARTAGWASGGGGPLLDLALDYDVKAHTTANARRLVQAVFGAPAPVSARPLLMLPDSATSAAAAILRPAAGRPLVGIHVSGGRPIKQWSPERFAEVGARLADTRGAAIVATGGPSDRALIAALQHALGSRLVIDASGADGLLASAAILQRLSLLITGDTGPMHLASAVGTPVVAVFGPSDPVRYATTGPVDRIVRIDLPCSPCNRIRQPPARCIGHIPDCLAGVTTASVVDAAAAVLDESISRLSRTGRS